MWTLPCVRQRRFSVLSADSGNAIPDGSLHEVSSAVRRLQLRSRCLWRGLVCNNRTTLINSCSPVARREMT